MNETMYLGANYKDYLGLFKYYFSHAKLTKYEKNELTFNFYDIEELVSRSIICDTIAFEPDLTEPTIEYILPLLYTINLNFNGYFILISNYQVYGNCISSKDEDSRVANYGLLPRFLAQIENFVKKNFKRFIIIRKPEVYMGYEKNTINFILKNILNENKLYLPKAEKSFVPILALKDYQKAFEKLMEIKPNEEIINFVDETIDLQLLRFVVDDDVKVIYNNDVLKFSVPMYSKVFKMLHEPEYKLTTYLKLKKEGKN